MPREQDDHYLSAYLQEELPKLGLDYETYGSYLKGLVDETDDDDESNWTDVLELLQASSETHSDDAKAWHSLEQEILNKKALHDAQLQQEAHQLKMQETKDKLQHDIELAQQQPAGTSAKPALQQEMDETKRALMDRFGYDEGTTYDKDGNLVVAAATKKSGDTAAAAPVTNKQAAAQAHLDKSREVRSRHNLSKREEQAKTKEQRQEKERLKDERRKRSGRRERKR